MRRDRPGRRSRSAGRLAAISDVDGLRINRCGRCAWLPRGGAIPQAAAKPGQICGTALRPWLPWGAQVGCGMRGHFVSRGHHEVHREAHREAHSASSSSPDAAGSCGGAVDGRRLRCGQAAARCHRFAGGCSGARGGGAAVYRCARSGHAGEVPVSRRRTRQLPLLSHRSPRRAPQATQGGPATPRPGADERRAQPRRQSEGADHHEPGRLSARDRQDAERPSRFRPVLLHHLRRSRAGRDVGLSRRGFSSVAQRDRRQGTLDFGDAVVLRRDSGDGFRMGRARGFRSWSRKPSWDVPWPSRSRPSSARSASARSPTS